MNNTRVVIDGVSGTFNASQVDGGIRILYFSRFPEVQSLLADFPLIAVGLFALAYGLILVFSGRLNRALFDLSLSGALQFFAGLFSLANMISCENGAARTRGLQIVTAFCLAFATTFRLGYLFRRAQQPGRDERARMVSDRLAQRMLDNDRRDQEAADAESPHIESQAAKRASIWRSAVKGKRIAVHSGLLTAYGGAGVAIRSLLFVAIFVIAVLESHWRIVITVNATSATGTYRASAALQLIFLVFVAVHMVSACFSSLQTYPLRNNLLFIAPILVAILIQLVVVMINLALINFSETPLGRLLLASSVFILLLNSLFDDFRSPYRDDWSFDTASISSDGGIKRPVIGRFSSLSSFNPNLKTSRTQTSTPDIRDVTAGPIIRFASRRPSWLSSHRASAKGVHIGDGRVDAQDSDSIITLEKPLLTDAPTDAGRLSDIPSAGLESPMDKYPANLNSAGTGRSFSVAQAFLPPRRKGSLASLQTINPEETLRRPSVAVFQTMTRTTSTVRNENSMTVARPLVTRPENAPRQLSQVSEATQHSMEDADHITEIASSFPAPPPNRNDGITTPTVATSRQVLGHQPSRSVVVDAESFEIFEPPRPFFAVPAEEERPMSDNSLGSSGSLGASAGHNHEEELEEGRGVAKNGLLITSFIQGEQQPLMQPIRSLLLSGSPSATAGSFKSEGDEDEEAQIVRAQSISRQTKSSAYSAPSSVVVQRLKPNSAKPLPSSPRVAKVESPVSTLSSSRMFEKPRAVPIPKSNSRPAPEAKFTPRHSVKISNVNKADIKLVK